MKTTLKAILATFACVAMAASTEEAKTPVSLWRLVASSDIIAVGDIRFDAVKGTDEYVTLELKVNEFLKSSLPTERPLKVRFYDRKETHGAIVAQFDQLSKQSNLVFLIQVDDPAVEGLYFAGNLSESVVDTTPQIKRAIDKELKLQETIARDFKADMGVPHYREVAEMLASIKDAESQQRAFSRLEALGKEAVPAIIAQMNDFRDLPNPSISLENPPGHWEGFRHYGPDKVVDALAAILNQLTHHSYRSIYNGGSDRERNACINAWRVHLHHIKNEAVQ